LTIKIWPWLIWHNAIAIKDNMKRRKWEGNTKCRFCDEGENIHHLFFNCAAAKYVCSCVARFIGAVNRHLPFPIFYGCSLASSMPVAMFRLQALQQSTGKFGNCVTKLVLLES
jgi:hypothetical protein